MRRRRLKKLWKRLGELRRQSNRRDQLMLKLVGSSLRSRSRKPTKSSAHGADLPSASREAATGVSSRGTLPVALQHDQRRPRRAVAPLHAHRNRAGVQGAQTPPCHPIFHQLQERIEAHIFVSFIAYCLLVTLKNLGPQAPGLTPRAILEKFPRCRWSTSTWRRAPSAPRHTQPNREHELLLRQLNLKLPKQPAPKLLS